MNIARAVGGGIISGSKSGGKILTNKIGPEVHNVKLKKISTSIAFNAGGYILRVCSQIHRRI